MAAARLLLSRGADPNQRVNKMAMLAAHQEQRSLVTLAAAAAAAGRDSLEMLTTQLDAGRRVQGNMTLWQAVKQGNTEIAEELVCRGARVQEVLAFEFDGGWIEVDKNSRGPDIHGTALHAAAKEGREDMVRWLMERGVDKEIVNGEGNTAGIIAEMEGWRNIKELINGWRND